MAEYDDEHIKSEIQAYLSGALLESRRRQLEAHIAGCSACRAAVTKARSKLSRARRQALKNAVPEPLPNLLFNRLGKQSAWVRPRSHHVWRWLGLVLVIGGIAILFTRKESRFSHISTRVPSGEETPVAESSAPAEAPAAESAPAAKNPAPIAAPAAPVAVSSPAAASVAASSPTAAAPPEPYVPQNWSGQDSGVKEVREVTFKGRTSWRALWQEMGQPEPPPRVNFYQAFVVGIFIGEKPSAGYAVTLGEPKEDAGNIIIPYKITEPAPGSAAATVVTHPYALMTIPRTAKPIHFEQSQ